MSVATIYNTPITGQVGAFNPVVMSTPGSEGNFRIGLYMWAPTFGQSNGQAKDIIIQVTWTDPSGTLQLLSLGLFTANTNVNSARADAGFRAAAGMPITLSYAGNATDVTDSYNVYPNLEQL